MSRRLLVGIVALTVAATVTAGRPRGQAPQRPTNADDAPLQIYHVRGPIYVLSGAGCNVTVSVGLDGVLVVDTGTAANSDNVLAAIRQLQNRLATSGVEPQPFGAETRASLERERTTAAPPKPIRYLLNTSIAADHTGGNAKIAAAGATATGGNVVQQLASAGQGAAIYAHENILTRMSQPEGSEPAAPFAALPTVTYHAEYYKIQPYFNGEGVEMVYQPSTTDGNSIVWFRGSDVIATGDLFSMTSYPAIDVQRGGTIQGTIDGLNVVLDLAFPEFRAEGGTMIVPGHGRLADSGDLAYYRDMVTIVRDRVQDLIRKGQSLEQVKAARPTADYDPRFSPSGSSSADKFVESVYHGLQSKK